MVTALLLAFGCAHRAPATVLPPFEGTDGFVIRAGERSLGGAAVVEVDDTSFALIGLAPSGTALFAVRGDSGGEVEVSAPDPAMADVLARIPVRRDLWLLYRWRCEGRCRAEEGVLTVQDGVVRWRGRGGPARVARTDGRATLTDPRRGYSITVAGAP
jgi:hypothetical protein